MSGDRQAESVTIGLGGKVRSEYFLTQFSGYTGTVIGDGYPDLTFGIDGIEHDDYIRIFLSIQSLDGIAYDVDKDLRYLFLIRKRHHTGVGSDIADGYLFIVGTLEGDDV